MTLAVTHTTPADSTFSSAGAAAWNAGHTISGSVDVPSGGTGVASLTAHGVVLGNGASPLGVTGVGANNTVLHGNTGADPSYSGVIELDLSLTDVLTGNVSTTKHGFAPKAPNDPRMFLDGTGAFNRAITTVYTSFSHDTSLTGAQAIGGLGFKPRGMVFCASLLDGVYARNGVFGFADGGGGSITMTTYNNAFYVEGGVAFTGDTSFANYSLATLSSWDAGGFTLNWSKVGLPTGTVWVYCLVFG